MASEAKGLSNEKSLFIYSLKNCNEKKKFVYKTYFICLASWLLCSWVGEAKHYDFPVNQSNYYSI